MDSPEKPQPPPNPANQLVENKPEKRMDFDQAHYEKFEREVKKEQDEGGEGRWAVGAAWRRRGGRRPECG